MTMNPDLIPFLKRWDTEWAGLPAGADAAARRARFEVVAANMRLPTPPEVDCTRETFVDSEAGPVRLRIFRHRDGGVQPGLIYLHGGAWMQGSPETHWDITARLAAWGRMTVLSVDYAKAPERPFPAAYQQVLAVAHHAHVAAADYGIDPGRLAIGGDSAGGNLAAAACLALRGTVPLAAQVLIYPACDFDRSRPSYSENPDGPLIRPDGKVEAMYCPDPALWASAAVQPLLADSHAGLPPALIAVAQHDPLRDSGVAYAEALRAAGVAVTLDPGPGLIHGYLRAMEFCPDSMARLRMIAQWLSSRLGTSE